jgi:hypothetical protein
VVIIDGTDIEVLGRPMRDISGLSLAEIRSCSFHDQSKAPAPPNTGGTGPNPDVQALIGDVGPATCRSSRRPGNCWARCWPRQS